MLYPNELWERGVGGNIYDRSTLYTRAIFVQPLCSSSS